MVQLAHHYGQGFLYLKDIAKNEDISERYLGQLIIPLRSGCLVNSGRGAHGGYMLAKEPSEISVKDVVEILEGLTLVGCVADPTVCNRDTFCVTKRVWGILEKKMSEALGEITLDTLVSTPLDEEKELVGA